jgi:hypothetical protein
MTTGDAQQKPWAQKTADEKLEHRLHAWSNPSVSFADPEAEAAYKARVGRLADAMLPRKEPDRVPVPLLTAEVYPAIWAGLTPYDAMYDFPRAAQAFTDFNVEFQPDSMVPPIIGALPGRVYELVDYRLYSWPGHGAPKEASFQYNEKEWMLAEEYDDFIADPTDFLTRRFIPRICGGLAGLAKLGSVLDPGLMAFGAGYFASWAQPEVIESLERAMAAGKEAAAWFGQLGPVLGRLQAMGFPFYFAVACQAPFDYLGDELRGTKQILLDLYRRPEKLIEACDRLTPMMIRWVTGKSTPDTPPCVFWPLHKGAEGFLSLEQFKTFYWPSLRTTALGLIEEGFIPVFFGEGAMDSRLEIIAADLPKGKTVWLLDRTDMAYAKATLGKVSALQGNVPLSLLQLGTPEAVREYCRTLIEAAAPGGGFLLDSGAVLHQCKAENVHAMIQSAHEFGVY